MLLIVEKLKTGMIIADDVYDENGQMLVPKGASLNISMIEKLNNFKIKLVNVKEDSNRIQSIEKFDEVYSQTLDKIKEVFKAAKYKKAIQLSDFEGVIDLILEESGLSRSVLTYMKLIEQKDEYTFQHSINVSLLSMLMGKWLDFSMSDIKEIGLAGALHDIGKVSIPDEILNKPGKLFNDEYSIIKEHTRRGFQILQDSGIKSEVIKNVVLTHHEKINGQGYPQGLKGEYICPQARIVTICDIYDAMTSDRVYKKKVNPLEAFNIILDGSYSGLDSYFCKVFLENAVIAYHGSTVVLNNNLVGRIIKIFPENPLRPWIAIDNKLIDLNEMKNISVVQVM